MRIALIADIHGNLPALESVMQSLKRHSPEMIISLGDQVNLGPSSREVLALLKAENVACLHGNHERYILSAMDKDPAYAGANFNSLRFQAGILRAEEISFPKTMEIGSAVFCHAMPEDDRFPVFDEAKAIPLLRQMAFPHPVNIFCGHGHNPTHIRMGNLSLNSIGSVGCMDAGVPGTAPYAILDMEKDSCMLRPYYTAYDVRVLPKMFMASGMAEFCPVMAHIACHQMMNNVDLIVPFVRMAGQLSAQKGETHISEKTWLEADARFGWPDGMRSGEFWAQMRKER